MFHIPEIDLRYVAEAAQTDLQGLQGARLFLTGGTSFIGKWLIESLLWANKRFELGLEVTALSRNPRKFLAAMPHLSNQPGFNLLEGDIATTDLRRGADFTHAIHGANLLNDGSADWALRHMDTAVDGFRNLLKAASACGCKNILFISSGGAYRAEPTVLPGGPAQTALKENQAGAEDNQKEPNVYGLTKRFIEAYATAAGAKYGIRIPLARCFTFCGPYMPLDGPQALGNFIRDALSGNDIVIKGDGSPIRSYMYGADLVVWLLALLLRGRHGTPYNVGSRESISIAGAAKAVAGCVGGDIKVRILGKAVEGNAPSVYVPDVGRAENELSLSCQFNFTDSLRRTVDWFKLYQKYN